MIIVAAQQEHHQLTSKVGLSSRNVRATGGSEYKLMSSDVDADALQPDLLYAMSSLIARSSIQPSHVFAPMSSYSYAVTDFHDLGALPLGT